MVKTTSQDVHLPLSGPSQSRIAAQHRMLKNVSSLAAEGLLLLQSGSNNDTGDNDGTESTSSSSGLSGSMHSLSSIADPEQADNSSTHSSSCSTCSDAHNTDQDGSNLPPVASVQDESPDMDDIPLAEVK